MKIHLLLVVILSIALQSLAISIPTKAVPNGIVKDPYLGVITVTGGCTPYKWRVISGSLPAGVAIKTSADTKSVTLSGRPTTATSYSFTISVTGCGGGVAKTSSRVVIQARAVHVVDLNWKASTSNNIAGYNIYRGPDGKSWTKVNVTPAASTIYSDSTVANRSTYFYASTAVDIAGRESKKSNIAKAAIP